MWVLDRLKPELSGVDTNAVWNMPNAVIPKIRIAAFLYFTVISCVAPYMQLRCAIPHKHMPRGTITCRSPPSFSLRKTEKEGGLLYGRYKEPLGIFQGSGAE